LEQYFGECSSAMGKRLQVQAFWRVPRSLRR
jgi:hypothetical protein